MYESEIVQRWNKGELVCTSVVLANRTEIGDIFAQPSSSSGPSQAQSQAQK